MKNADRCFVNELGLSPALIFSFLLNNEMNVFMVDEMDSSLLCQQLKIEPRDTRDLARCYVDSHCHLADQRIDAELWISKAKQLGIGLYLQGGVGPEDWQRQLELADKFSGVIPCFGLHPYFVAEHNEAEIELALDQLARAIKQARAVGEMGLDLRPHIAKNSQDLQTHAFISQIELALMIGKPMVLHVVQAFDETQNIFSHWLPVFESGSALRGIVHSFNGSWPQAQSYMMHGFGLSVGGPLLRPQNQKLKQAVAATPLDFLFLETDAPDQPPPQFSGQHNPAQSLLFVAEEVAKLKNISTQQVLDICSQNLRRLLSKVEL